jgi:hypothetical protein
MASWQVQENFTFLGSIFYVEHQLSTISHYIDIFYELNFSIMKNTILAGI